MNCCNNKSTISIDMVGNLGTAVAVAISWSVNKSIAWAILHGMFSWFYVLYYAVQK